MRLATRRDGSRDGRLVVVAAGLERCAPALGIAKSLQAALDDWDGVAGRLLALQQSVDAGAVGEPFDPSQLMAPLPRAYEWIDGSAFIHHVELARRARGAEPPRTLLTDPLVYQGGSGHLLGPREPVPLTDPEVGLDFEGELAVVVGDVPRGTPAAEAASCIRLVMLANDWTLRNRVPSELEKGFGFVVSKPATAFSPLAVTPDELGQSWREARVHLPLRVSLNGRLLGQPNAGEMHFSFAELIAHVARTRSLTAGSIIGSGTVSNRDPRSGVACLVELRMQETLQYGAPRTSYLKPGDRVCIEVLDEAGDNLFGSIDQEVVAA